MDSLLRDVRFAVRSLIQRPGFSLVTILTIAIGIGANSAIFSVVHAVLLEPIPVHEPSELVVPDVIAPSGFSISTSIPNFRDWRDRNRSFASFGGNAGRGRTLTGGDRPEVVQARFIIGDFFETLGVEPAQGRLIPAEETFEGAPPNAVITYGFWQRYFGGENALGEVLILNDEPFTVIGIMPQSFVFPNPDTEIYLPMGYFEQQLCWTIRGCSQGTWAIARLAPGVTMAAAQQDLDRIVREIEAEEGNEQARPVLETVADTFVGDVRRYLWLLMGAVAFVLLIACANVASLSLVRGEARRREIAVRTALGAGRGRVARQLLTESLVLASIGGVLGIGLAFLGIRGLVPLIQDSLPAISAERIGLDGPVLLFTLVATLLAGVLFGLAPTLRLSNPDLTSGLKEGGRGASGSSNNRLRASMVILEVALSLVLLIGAGLMVQSVRQLRTVDKGFDESGIFTAQVALPQARYPSRDDHRPFYLDLQRRVAALPGVESATLSQILPLQGNSWEQSIYPEGVPYDQENANSVLFYMVTPEHFDVFGIPVLGGRTFDAQDRDGNALVAVIDETMAERFWPGENAVGKRVTFESDTNEAGDTERIFRTVVGVVRNVRHYELESAARITVYVPYEQSGGSGSRNMNIVAKTAMDPTTLATAVRGEVAALDPEVPISEVQTMEAYVDEAMSGANALGTLLSAFGLVATLLSAIGLFGLMSFTVAQRFRDIGIRMALGATTRRVIMGVSSQGLRLTVLGIVVGLVAAVFLTRLMTGVLYEVDPLEPVVFMVFAALLMVVATLATWVPALRATRIDPAVVLREE